MMTRLARWLRGWVLAHAEGSDVGELINEAVRHGVEIWRVRRAGHAWTLRVGAAGWTGLDALARDRGVALRSERRVGAPYLLARVWRRRVLALGALGFVLAAWLLGSFVWVVDVSGASEVAPEAVLRAASELGLARGTFRPAIDRDRVARLLPMLLPNVSWATIRIRGTRATIEIAEEAQVPPEFQPSLHPADVVAGRDGVITSVLVLTGQALVRPGDTVSAGQVLIRSTVESVPRGYDPTDPRAPRMAMLVRARGRVEALVWYHQYLELPAVKALDTPTGRTYTRYQVVVAGRNYAIWGWRRPPFSPFAVETRAWRPGWPAGGIEFVRTTYMEVHRRVVAIPAASAEDEARRRARAEVAAELPPGARIRGETADVIVQTPTRYGVIVQVETEQDIGVTQEVPGAGSS